jgi:hypothetical protein
MPNIARNEFWAVCAIALSFKKSLSTTVTWGQKLIRNVINVICPNWWFLRKE